MKRLAFVGILTMLLAFFASTCYIGATSLSGEYSLSTTDNDLQQHSGFGVSVSGNITSAQFLLTELLEEPSLHEIGSSFWDLVAPHKISADQVLDNLFWDTNVPLSASFKRLIFPFHSFW